MTAQLTGTGDSSVPQLVVAGGVPSQGAPPTSSMPRHRPGRAGAQATPSAAYRDWAQTLSATTGVPARALTAFAVAQRDLADDEPRCHLAWPTLAGIGYVESANGELGGGLRASGRPADPIVGVALTGIGGVAAVEDSDRGTYDGDSALDRAVGPLQFLPSTWSTWGADGDRDGVEDPQDIDDAALAAGRYLCAAGDLASPTGWSTAVLSYNRSEAYLAAVLSATNTFAQRSLSTR